MKTSSPPDEWEVVSDVAVANKTKLSNTSFMLWAVVAFLTVGVVTFSLIGGDISDFGS